MRYLCILCGYALWKTKTGAGTEPEKSIEGAIGGVAGAALLGAIYGMVVSGKVAMNNAPVYFAIICAVGAVISQFGDLIASGIKRQHGIKDYGKLIPGHGGVLDRFDSVLFTAPMIAIWSQVWPIIWVLFG